MKKILGILALTQIIASYSWGMERDSALDERLIKALRVLAINQDKDLRGLPIEHILLEKDSTTLVVALRNTDEQEQVELNVPLTAGGFIAGPLKVLYNTTLGIISGVEEITLSTTAAASVSGVGDTEEETSASVSAVTTAPSEPPVSEQVRMGTKNIVGGDLARILGSAAEGIVQSGDGKKILRKLGFC